ncbi:MAG: hypothetical histidine triad protein [Candidatus Hydrogenedentota bacterium]
MKEARENCIFCAILEGDAPVSTIFEDELCCAFMDIRPVNPGHALVIPKVHAPYLKTLNPDMGGRLFQVAMRVAEGLRHSGIPCEGINLFLADGEVAMQEVFHVHLHVLPRTRGDEFGLRFPLHYGNLPRRDELDTNARRIANAMG